MAGFKETFFLYLNYTYKYIYQQKQFSSQRQFLRWTKQEVDLLR